MTTPSIPAQTLNGLDCVTSVIAMGTSAFGNYEQAAPVYDRYVQAGGNFFDTAWVYGQNYEPGCCERTLGDWMTRRGVTDHMAVLVKGGHPPYCTPDALSRQLAESLDRLNLGRATLYMLHRDDTTIAVGEFVDVLNSFVDDGLIGGYGFSNWSLDRIADAIAFARRKNYTEPVAVSNQMSLAVMEQPIYPGCLHVSDTASRAWLEQSKLALVPWSSQGRGVFTKPASKSDLANGELSASWFSADNWRRVERARELASQHDVHPVNIALAWVLHQPFPTFPIIGPRTAEELSTSLRALDVSLTLRDLAWLNLETTREA